MDDGILRNRSRFFGKSTAKAGQPQRKQDYGSRLWSTSDFGSEVGVELETGPYVRRVRELVTMANGNGVAFQSVAVAALGMLRRVMARQRHAERAAISLAQREKLKEMIESVEATAEAVSDVLNPQGLHMLSMAGDTSEYAPDEPSWWFALTETIQSIENESRRLASLASTQPKGSRARDLSSVILRLLRNQNQQLLSEAEAWIA